MKELECLYDTHKSFYHKAHVEQVGNITFLVSYTTRVCCLIDGKAYRRFRQPQSDTTARHMKEFLRQNGFGPMSISDLRKLPVMDEFDFDD